MPDDSMTQPFWWNAAPLQDGADAEARPEPECDVAIVGAGYTGLAAAIVLARAGRSVTVFDRQRPGEGASSRNGGIMSGSLRIGLGQAIATMGQDDGVALHAEGKRAREDLWRFIREEEIDCDAQESGRFTGAMTPGAYESQAREADLLNRHLDLGAEMVPRERQREEVGTDLYHGGMVRPDIGHLHPGKLHAGLLARARSSGATVLGEMPVRSIRREGTGFEVKTTRGTLRAGQVLMATNGYTDGVSPWLRRRLVAVKSRIIATEPLSQNLMRHLIPRGRAVGETRKLYRYYRPSPDGTRILIGGRERVLTRDPAANAEHLRRGLVGIFPELADVKVEQSWHGNVAFSRDYIPRLFEHDGILHACGYCGSGVVWARWLGERAAYRLLGAPEAETVLAGPPPAAVPLFEGWAWFMPFAMASYALQDAGYFRNSRTG